jgi:hypothetical protein
MDEVGLARVLPDGEKDSWLPELSGASVGGLKDDGPKPCDPKGFSVDGTDRRRPGIRRSAYMLAVLEWPWMGDPMAEPHWELSYPPEYLDDVGVLKPLLTKPLDT